MSDGQWTIETVLEHLSQIIEERFQRLETRIEGNDRRYEQQFERVEQAATQQFRSMEQAVLKAEAADQRRFEAVNEFRSTLGDQQRTLMPRTEAEVKFDGLSRRIDTMTDTLSLRLATLEKADRERAGRNTGVVQGWGWAVAVVALIGAVLAIFLGRQ